MSGEDRNLQAQCRHLQGERPVKYTFCFLSSVLLCVLGNSFPHGYNIGVVNSPASIVKLFYAKVNLAKEGIVTYFKDGFLYYDYDMSAKKNIIGRGIGLERTANSSYNMTFDQKVVPDEDLMDLWWSVTVAMFVLFGMFGAFVSGKIADGFGRKKGMLIVTVAMLFAALLGFISKLDAVMSPACLIMSRAFAGLHCGINISLAALYLAEIAPKEIRGAVGTTHQLFITIGIFWSSVMGLPEVTGSWDLWNLCFAFNALPAIVCLCVFPLCPESPRFLLIKKLDEKNAVLALQRLRGYDDVDDEIAEMKYEAHRAASVPKFSRCQLLTSPELRKPLVIALILQVAQQWSGINAVMSYSSFILRQANISLNKIPYVIVGQGAVNVFATIVAIPLLEKAGRRPLLLYPMIVMAISYIAFGIGLMVLKQEDTEMANSGLAIACIILMGLYIVGFAIGLGPLPYVVVTEVFRQGPRAAAMGFSLAINWICNLTLVVLFPFIQKNVKELIYVFFGVIIIGSAVFFFFCLPETKNRTFADIADSVANWRTKLPNMVEETGEESLPMNIGSTEQMSDNSSASTNMNRESRV